MPSGVHRQTDGGGLMPETTQAVLEVPVTPVAKPRMTQRDKWKKRPRVMAYRAYCDELRLRAGRYELPEQFHVVFQIPMPTSWSVKKRERMIGTPHRQRPDVDNLVKALADALCVDDSHLWDVRATKLWADHGSISIRQLETSE
jgi:Holliday junction resolvase RusA-like endonuclease